MAYLLTEENIKHCTLGFLKTYYKNNSSRGFGASEAKLDMVTADKIVADGYLKFSVNDQDEHASTAGNTPDLAPKKATKSFLATFEATSQDTAEEIQYKVQNTLLLFDAFAVAFLIAAGSYGFNYLRNQFTLNELGFVKFWLGFFAVLLTSLIAYILLFRYFPRYRYIYAIAQFKRYFADEQWIAYGEDVFEHPDNKYLVELKKQCMRKGLGLISVNQQLIPTLVMTPARNTASSAGKRIKAFFSSTATITQKRFKWLKLPIWLKEKLPAINWEKTVSVPLETTTNYMRFTQSYWKQGLIILFSILVMGEIYWEELKNPNWVYLDHKDYEEQVLQKKYTEKEPNATFLDLETGSRKEVVNPTTVEVPTPAIEEPVDLVIKSPPPLAQKQAANPRPISEEYMEKGVIVSTNSEEFIAYSCDRLAHLTGEFYVVQVEMARTYEEALKTVKFYAQKGFKVNAFSLNCFYKNKASFVIYLDDIFPSRADAAKRKTVYHKLMIAKDAPEQDPLIRVIKRMK